MLLPQLCLTADNGNGTPHLTKVKDDTDFILPRLVTNVCSEGRSNVAVKRNARANSELYCFPR